MHNSVSLNMTIISTIIAMISTILGASFIFFKKIYINTKYEKFTFGIIYGMMLSSMTSSISIPSVNLFNVKNNELLFAICGAISGIIFMKSINKIISSRSITSSSIKKNYIVILSSSLRNMIEGILIGIAFSLSYNSSWNASSAVSLSITMILQNFLESFSISLIFKDFKLSLFKSFLIISIPGFLEPIGGVLGVILFSNTSFLLSFILSLVFTIVIVSMIKELVHDYVSRNFTKYTIFGLIIGFILLLFIDKIIK